MTLNELRLKARARNTKNFKFVVVRKSHSCRYCGKIIKAGTEALTTNKKNEGRVWACLCCVEKQLQAQTKKAEAMQNLAKAQAFKASVAFGDEGAYMAAMEWESEALGELEELDEYEEEHEDD